MAFIVNSKDKTAIDNFVKRKRGKNRDFRVVGDMTSMTIKGGDLVYSQKYEYAQSKDKK